MISANRFRSRRSCRGSYSRPRASELPASGPVDFVILDISPSEWAVGDPVALTITGTGWDGGGSMEVWIHDAIQGGHGEIDVQLADISEVLEGSLTVNWSGGEIADAQTTYIYIRDTNGDGRTSNQFGGIILDP